jgi:signal transduction histidine kinase
MDRAPPGRPSTGAAPERLKRARSAANRKVAWYGHVIVYALAVTLVLVTAGFFAALVLALSWGVGVASHGFFAVAAPRLRERWIAESLEHNTREPASADAPRASRTTSLAELSAAVAHEIRNPITAAKSLVQQIAEDPGGSDTAEHARVAVDELDRVERSIAHLLRFAREEPFEPRELELSLLLDGAIETMIERAETEGVRIVREVDAVAPLRADAEALRKLLENLIANALDALRDASVNAPCITIAAGENLAGTEVWIAVRDNGPGVPESAREQLFRPFYTSKSRGTGLGLALARKTAERHGGTLVLSRHEGPGAEFLLTLPRRE